MLNPPITGNGDLDAWMYQLSVEGLSSGSMVVGNIPTSGDPVGYPYQFIHIKYADDTVGGGFVNVPAYKMYWGIYNSRLSTESTNPADYTWFKSPVGFGALTSLYYLILGGRQIKFALDTAQPSYKWLVDSGLAIDLDSIVPAATISFNEMMDAAVTELKIAANAVTATKINVAALDQSLGGLKANTVSAAQIIDNAVTELKILDGAISNGKLLTGTITGDKIFANTITGSNIAALTIGASAIAAGAITSVKIDAGAITSAKINAGAVTADKITVTNLAAIKATLGAVTAGTITASSFATGGFTGYAWPAGVAGGSYIDSNGALFGNANDTNKYLQITAAGDIYAPQFSIVNGVATFAGALNAASGTFSGNLNAVNGTFSGVLTASAINAVNTTNIVGNAVTSSNNVSGNANTITTTLYIPPGETMRITAIATWDESNVSGSVAGQEDNSISINGVQTSQSAGAFIYNPNDHSTATGRPKGTYMHILDVYSSGGLTCSISAYNGSAFVVNKKLVALGFLR